MLSKGELDRIRGIVREEVSIVRKEVSSVRDEVNSVREEVAGVEKRLKGDIEKITLKVEAFHSEQKQANAEIIGTLHDIIETNAKETEKRFVRIEKHLNLPPLK